MYKEVKEVKDRSGSCPLLPEPPLRPSPPESRESILDFRPTLRHNFASGLRGPRGPTSRFLLHGGFLMRLLVAALVAALALLPTCASAQHSNTSEGPPRSNPALEQFKTLSGEW